MAAALAGEPVDPASSGVAAFALAVVTLAAYLLPVWQWDALGYHLPYVNFALQRGTFADIPSTSPTCRPIRTSSRTSSSHSARSSPMTVWWNWRTCRLVCWRRRLVIAYRQAPARVRGRRPRANAARVFLQLPTTTLMLPRRAVVDRDRVRAQLRPCTRVILAAIALACFSSKQAPLPRLVFARWPWPAGVRIAHDRHRGRGRATPGWRVLPDQPCPPGQSGVAGAHRPWPDSPARPVSVVGLACLRRGRAARARQSRQRVFDSWTTIWPAVPAFDMRVGGLGS